MGNCKIKLGLVSVITIFFVMGYVIPTALSENVQKHIGITNFGNIYIVDDEGDGDFINIQDAIDDSNDDDVIKVFSGEFDNFIVDKKLTIIGLSEEYENGSDTGKPIINGGSGNAIEINEIDRVSISGFYITNSGEHGIYLKDTKDVIISDNYITGNYFDGIFGDDISNTYITHNYINYNGQIGIVLQSSDTNNIYKYNYILGNNIENNGQQGILLQYINHNVISGNNIEMNLYHGIAVWYSHYNNILYNNFIQNNAENFQPRLNFWNSHINVWRGNYWDKPMNSPKLIKGSFNFGPTALPWWNYDWHPAKVMHEI